jgi:PKD repeat protein
MLGSRVNSQNHAVCSDAFYKLIPADTCQNLDFSVNNIQNQIWLVFQASDSVHVLSVDSSGFNTTTFSYVVLYNGNCGNLTLIDSMGLGAYPAQMTFEDLIPGSEYIIRLDRSLLEDCPGGNCPVQESATICLRNREREEGVFWGDGLENECNEFNEATNVLICTLQVCVNETLLIAAGQIMASNIFQQVQYGVHWSFPGSTTPFLTSVLGPVSVVYTTPGLYLCYWEDPANNGQVVFYIEVIDDPITNINYILSDNIVCPEEMIEILNLSSNGDSPSYNISVNPGVPVNGNSIGPFPSLGVGNTYTISINAFNACGDITVTEDVLVDYQLGFETEVRCDKVIVTPNSPCEVSANWTYVWDFGDGSPLITSGFGSVTHAYATVGFYTITLTTKDNTFFPGITLGLTSEVVHIEGIPIVEFSSNESCGQVNFINSTRCDSYITGWHWDFGDGTASTGQVPVPNPHVYSANGTYTVTLIATHSNGQVYSQTQTITVTTLPVPLILEGPTRLCCSDLTFSVLNGTYDDYNWSFSDPQWNGNIFGNGTSTVSIIPPPEVDKITLCVTVLDENRCEATACIELSNADCCPEVVLTDPENGSSPQVNLNDVIVETSFCGETYLSTLLDVNALPLAPYYDAAGKYIYINHDLIIDVNVTIVNANIRVLGGHQLTVQDGVMFNLNNCVAQAKCSNVMWKGINLEAAGSELHMSNVTVKHAERAVQSNAGALYDIANSNFINNWVGIQVNLLSVFHAGTVHGSVFTTNAMLFPPYAGFTEGFAGVNLNSVPDIQIGLDVNNGGNSFSNLQSGIKGNASGARIYNNSFQGIGNMASAVSSQKGIYFTSRIISRQLVVGGSTAFQPNSFDNVNIGIHTDGRVNTSIVENTFNEIFNYGIWLTRNMPGSLTTGSHLVENNNFYTQQGKIAIWAQDNNNTIITIDGNVINDYSNSIEQGILVSNTVANTTNPNVLVQVTNNRIRQALLGIGLINVPRVYAAFNRPQVNVTNANLNATGLTYTGIRMENCLEGELDGNQVSRVGGLPASENQLTGIWVESSMMAYVHENTVEGWGKGIHVQDNNLNSRLYCNTLRKNWNGFYFTNAVIGDQGEDPALNPPSGLASDNRWIANQGADRMDGNLLAVSTWYYRPGGLYFPQISVGLGGLVNLFPLNNQAISECGAGAGPGGGIRTPGAAIRRHYFQDVASGNSLFSQYATEHQFWAESHSHRIFNLENAWLNVDPVDDTLYQLFYSLQHSGNKGAMVMAEQAFAQNDTTNMNAQCSSIVPACNQESLLLQVYQMASQKYLTDSVWFSTADSLWLYNLACSEPLIDGAAVFAARSLLGLPIGCLNENLYRSPFESIQEDSMDNRLLVYPNPTKGVFSVKDVQPLGSIILYDATGRMVLKQESIKSETFDLEISNLQNGMYLLEVISGENRQILQVSKQ